MSTNNQTNSLIKWAVVVTDFVLLNAIVLTFILIVGGEHAWMEKSKIIYILIQNLSLVISESRFYTIVHQRIVGAGDILRRILGLVSLQAVVAVIMLKLIISDYTINIHFWMIEAIFLILMMAKRFVERWFIKLYREAGRNIRSVTLVGSDPELIEVYKRLIKDPTLGYNILGYYGDESLLELFEKEPEAERRHGKKRQEKLERLGSFEEFMAGMNNTDSLTLGDELYVSISRKDKQKIRRISQMCNSRVIRFYYVPVSVEMIGLDLKRELLDDMEIFTTSKGRKKEKETLFSYFLASCGSFSRFA